MEHMDKRILSSMIDSAMHREPADLVIKNCNVVDVYTGTVREDSIAIMPERKRSTRAELMPRRA